MVRADGWYTDSSNQEAISKSETGWHAEVSSGVMGKILGRGQIHF